MGFPQKGPGKTIFKNGHISGHSPDVYPDSIDACYLPTLSELIDACGEKFYGIHRMVDGEWLAFIYDIEDSTRQLETKGSTPEEAVANLWLAINQK